MLKETLKPETKLTFEVWKKADGATIKSEPHDYTIHETGAAAKESAKAAGQPQAASASTVAGSTPAAAPPNKYRP